MDAPLRDAYDRLRAAVGRLGSAVIGFSGGVDSALVLKVCHDALGGRALAVTGKSSSLAPEELGDAVRIAREIGARHVFIETEELADAGYAQNPVNRCYFCKSELYRKLRATAAREGIAHVVDGINADDAVSADRPGTQASERSGVVSPLREAGLGKAEVRAIARALGLSIWDKPAMACLSSRIPFGEEITPGKLAAVAAAEGALRRLGFKGARVRHHGAIARIELRPDELARAVACAEIRGEVVREVRAAGFTYVAIDLEGYRTGSMHEVLAIRPAPPRARPATGGERS